MIAWVLAVVLAAPSSSLPSAHFNRAQHLFAQGHYREALDEFTAASESAPREVPDLWFDIGQCHRNLGNARQAVVAFRRYLALKPDAPDRARVVAMIEKLGGSVDDLPDPASSSQVTLASVVAEPSPSSAHVALPGATHASLSLPGSPPGEGPSPPAGTVAAHSDIAAPAAHPEPASPASLALVPSTGDALPPAQDKPRRRRTWPIWVGVASAVAAVAAVGIGVGVGVGASSTHPMPLPMQMPTGATSLGTNVTIDTRGK